MPLRNLFKLFDDYRVDDPADRERLRQRIALDLAGRTSITPLAYPVTGSLLLIAYWEVRQDWPWLWLLLVGLLGIVLLRIHSSWRLTSRGFSEQAFKQTVLAAQLSALCWGLMIALFVGYYGLDEHGMLALLSSVAMSAGVIGTLTVDVGLWLRYLLLAWVPTTLVLLRLTLQGEEHAALVLFLAVFFIGFFPLQGIRVAREYLARQSARLKLEHQRSELEQHRDHLSELVDAKTADLRRAMNQAEQAKEQAEQANAAKTEFMNNVSHELRTPLHAIVSFARLGAKRAEQDKQRGYFEKIEQAGAKLTGLVDQLLDLDDMESGRVELNYVTAPLGRLLELVADSFGAVLAGRQIELRLNTCEVDIELDPQRIEQVLGALLSNAVRYSPAGGVVRLDCHKDDGCVLLSVSDQGPGVPEDERESIFERFEQSTATRDGSGGRGLGLTLARAMVRAHGGRIWVEQAADGGALFKIWLPLKGTSNNS